MIEFKFSELPESIDVKGRFDSTCRLLISAKSLDAINEKKLIFRIHQHGQAKNISDADIRLEAKSGNIKVFVGADDSQVIFGLNTSGAFDLRLWRKPKVTIAANTTSNGARIVCDLSEVDVGTDCMFSDEILIQSADQHGIVDLRSGQIVNNVARKIRVGDHVWLGRRSILMPDVVIGTGAIIGTGAVVTTDIPESSVAVGVPARVVKTQTTWSRSATHLDAMARDLVDRHRIEDVGKNE